jgi:hypothetical protein
MVLFGSACLYIVVVIVVQKNIYFIEDQHRLMNILLARLSTVIFPMTQSMYFYKDANEFDSLLFHAKPY